MNILEIIAKELELNIKNVEGAVKLLDEGATVPFIARYRKEATGAMTDEVLRKLDERLKYLRNLFQRKEEVIRLIEEQDKMTEELREKILSAESLARVEDLYRPYVKKKGTRASKAIENGFEPLARAIWEQEDLALVEKTLEELKSQLDFSKEEILQGAKDIVAEYISDDADIRQVLLKYIRFTGILQAEKGSEENDIYQDYFEYKESLRTVLNHRILALNRGEEQKALKISIQVSEDGAMEIVLSKIVKNESFRELLNEIGRDAYKRLIFPSLEREVRRDLTERAQEDAIGLFAKNLEALIMQRPLKGKRILALDPGVRTGSKISILDEFGKYLANDLVYIAGFENRHKESEKKLLDLISKYKIDVVAIGNGTASRDNEKFVADLIKKHGLKISYTIVSEAGASIYSASKEGIEEFPDLDVTVRGAISIGRRLQDPLSELVKISPRHLGVGQYQHDLNEKRLDQALDYVVESCVNRVGVNINTASISLLKHVSGLSLSVAKNILEYRDKEGYFKNRKELKEIKGLGPKTYEMCAGFLRIIDGEEFLDSTAVHPESYKAAKALLALDYKTKSLKELEEATGLGSFTLKDVIEELEKPGRDIRDSLDEVFLKEGIVDIKDLKIGMELKGTVRNIVDFGAFVDVGLHSDGLIHVSKLSKKFIKHPLEVVKLGDKVDVEVIGIDLKRDRISLKMKGVD
ncbi:RNA-binding transcriptional accessory protein [Peptoniphilus sp. GNH]|nr:RNA-binding transcriptional accessory protein [Peptoniphilus sp. GNH]